MQANNYYICIMPGYHKQYQKGTGSTEPRSPGLKSTATPAQRKKRVSDLLTARSAFFPLVPTKTPEEAKIERIYGKNYDAPEDDDGMSGQEPKKKSAMQGMRFIKENQDGTGKADNKGLMALGRSGAKGREAYERITGKEFKEAGMGMKYRMGTGMADEKLMEYGRMMKERGEKLMAMGAKMEPSLDPEPGMNEMTMGEKMYQDGTGQMTDSEMMRQEMMAQRMAERGMSPGQRSRMKMLESQEEMDYTPPTGKDYKGPLYKMPEIKEIVRSGSFEGIDLERLAATASRGSLPANLRGMIMQFLEEGPGAAPQQVNQPAERAVTQTPTQFSFQEGPRGEGGTLTIQGRQSDIKKRTMGGRNQMYVR